MKKRSFIALAIAAAMSTGANANDGTLQFTGNLTASSCTVTPGGDASGGAGKNILVDMGTVPFNELQDASSVTSTVDATLADISLEIDCGGTGSFNTLVMTFDPYAGSGFDTSDYRLLGLAGGGAEGAAIALVDNSTGKLIDLYGKPTVHAQLLGNGNSKTASVQLGATYLRTAGDEKPGVANASLPFVLTYE